MNTIKGTPKGYTNDEQVAPVATPPGDEWSDFFRSSPPLDNPIYQEGNPNECNGETDKSDSVTEKEHIHLLQ